MDPGPPDLGVLARRCKQDALEVLRRLERRGRDQLGGNEVPPRGVLLLAYLIGQLGGLIPIPAGIGSVDGGLIGTLVLFGTGATQAAVAVLAYRALVLWIPIVLGVPSLASLRRRPPPSSRADQRPSASPC